MRDRPGVRYSGRVLLIGDSYYPAWRKTVERLPVHLPDGFVNGPINVAAGVASVTVCAVALRRARDTMGDRQIPLVGVTAAFVFAAQMLNFPIAGGTSGHFMGAALTAILMGPLSAVLVLALVLSIQCLVFADGGITALGTNILNMGIVGGFGAYGLFVAARAILPKRPSGYLAAVAVASWGSIVLASAACAVELGLSGTYPLVAALVPMVGVHAVIGMGEALITCVTVKLIMAGRPDLIATGGMPAPATAMQES